MSRYTGMGTRFSQIWHSLRKRYILNNKDKMLKLQNSPKNGTGTRFKLDSALIALHTQRAINKEDQNSEKVAELMMQPC